MPVVHDAQSSGVSVSAASTSVTWSHTCTGTNRAIRVGVSNAFNTSPTGVTYAGVALTLITGASQNLPVDDDNATFWASVGFEPASGANNVVVTFAASTFDILCGAHSVTGADTSNCVAASNKATGTSTTPSVTITTNSNEIVSVHIAAIHNGTCAPGTDEDELYDRADGGGATVLTEHGYRQAGSAGGVVAPTLSASSEWSIGGISFKAASAGGGDLSVVLAEGVSARSTF